MGEKCATFVKYACCFSILALLIFLVFFSVIRQTPKYRTENVQPRILLIGGGAKGGQSLNLSRSIEVYSPNATENIDFPSFQNGRRFHSAGVIEGKIIITGGRDETSGLLQETTEIYSPKTKTWNLGAPMITTRRSAAFAVLDSKFFVCGGENSAGTYLSDCEIYNISTDRWTALSKQMSQRRAGAAAVAFKDFLYIFGGNDDTGLQVGSVEKYDPVENKWTFGVKMIYPKSLGAAAVFGEVIYYCGGVYRNGALKSCEIFDPAENQWYLAGLELNQGRRTFQMVNFNGTLYALGGTSEVDASKELAVLDTVEALATGSQDWMLVQELEDPRAQFVAVIF